MNTIAVLCERYLLLGDYASDALNKMNKTGVIMLVILLLLTGSGTGQRGDDSQFGSQNLHAFTKVEGQPEYLSSTFEFSTPRHKYKISSSGRGSRTGGGSAARTFNVRLDKGDSLERAIYYAEHRGDVLLLCEVTDGDNGAGFVARLDGQTLRVKWKQWIPAFNIGQGLIEEDSAYVTAHGFVGKVNLKSGAFVWRHDHLFRAGDTFNLFELPTILGEAVLFKENTIYSRPAKAIKVDKRTGKVLNIG